MTNSDLISDFTLLAEKPYDLNGLWKANAYEDVAALNTRLTRRVSEASAEEKRHLLAELTPHALRAQGSISALLSGLIVARLVCTQEDGWELRRGMLATPTAETLERLAGLEQSLNGKSNAGALFVKGLHRFWFGNRVEGFAAFRSLGVDPDFKSLVRDDLRGAPTCYSGALAESGGALPEPPALELISSCSDTGSAIALATFDDIYFKAFARKLLVTANEAGDARLHFHIVNPSPESFKLARELVSLGKSKKSSVGISYEHRQITDRASLACARFIIMETLLRHYGQGLLVTDADLFYQRPFGDLMTVLDQSRIALAIQSDPRGGGYLPWRAVSAGYLFVPYTDAGVLFSQRVANAIHRSWQEGSNWWVDQTALYCAFNQFGEKFGEQDIAMLPTDIHKALPTSEAYKIKMISEVPEVGAAMASGMHWNAALHSVQTKPQARADIANALGTKLRRTAARVLKRKPVPPPQARAPSPAASAIIAPSPPPAPVISVKPLVPMDAYQISADEMGNRNVQVPATIVMEKISREGASMVRLSGGDPSAPSMGRTGGLSIRVPDGFEYAVSTNRVRVEVVAKSAAASAAQFSVAYSTAEVGNSGWHVFVAGPSFETHRFEWNVPKMKDGHGDFVGILPQVGDAIEVKSMRVEVVRRAG